MSGEGGFAQHSEPWLRDDEAVCPVTGYVYLRSLGVSPYIKEFTLSVPTCASDAERRNMHTDIETRKFSAANA